MAQSSRRSPHFSPIVDFLSARYPPPGSDDGKTADRHPRPSAAPAARTSGMAPKSADGRTRSFDSMYPPSATLSFHPPSFTPRSSSHNVRQHITPQYQDIPVGENLGNAPCSALNSRAGPIGGCYGLPLFLMPSSNTHPLINRPEPRTENCEGADIPSRPSTAQRSKESAITTARNRALMMTSKTSSSLTSESMPARSIASFASQVSPAQAYTRGLRMREELAVGVALEPRYVQEWGYFLKCYCEGRFSISRPPKPPPHKPSFTFLPALPPLNEVHRQKAYAELDFISPNWALRENRRLVETALEVVDASHGSISIFSRNSERMKAECGYNRVVIPRPQSLAAHLLLANGPMVILDTHNDWRFARHPLVEGPPYIRFYAAFPLITADGYVVGAFAVFDPEPRYSFELDMRSDLEDLARKAVQHLVAVSHDLQSMHETELFVADEVRSLQTSRPASSVSGSARAESYRSYTPTPLNPRGASGGRLAAPDPFSSFPSVSAPSMKHYEAPAGHVEPTASQAQPPTPPYTPVKGNPLSRSGLTKWDAVKNANDGQPRPGPGRDDLARDEVETESPEAATAVRPETAKAHRIADPPKETEPGEVAGQETWVGDGIPVEAGCLVSTTAKNLGWDLIYVVRVYPTFSSLAAAQFSNVSWLGGGCGGRGGREFDRRYIRLLASHGFPDPAPELSLWLHLGALRSAGGIQYRHDMSTGDGHREGLTEQYAYPYGLIMPLVRDPVWRQPGGKKLSSSSKSSSSSLSCSCSYPSITSTINATTSGSKQRTPSEDNSRRKQKKQSSQQRNKTQSSWFTGKDTHDAAEPAATAPDGVSPEIVTACPHCDGGLVLGAFQRQAPSNYLPSPEEILSLREAGQHLKELLLDPA